MSSCPGHVYLDLVQIRNLGRNILYRVCDELTRRNRCGPVETGFIYRLFADIPREAVDSSINSLLDRGWLRKTAGGEGFHLTDEGLAEIRGFIPSPLRPTCEPPEERQ